VNGAWQGQGLDRSMDFKQSGTRKSGLPYKFAGKLPLKREIFIVQFKFDKIISF
jgi:hypothetical protein